MGSFQLDFTDLYYSNPAEKIKVSVTYSHFLKIADEHEKMDEPAG
jgi:hypothetical protein